MKANNKINFMEYNVLFFSRHVLREITNSVFILSKLMFNLMLFRQNKSFGNIFQYLSNRLFIFNIFFLLKINV